MERASEAPSSDHSIINIASAAAGSTTVAASASAIAAADGVHSNGSNIGNISSPLSSRSGRGVRWPTIDGSLGLSEEESLKQAQNFFRFGFILLPWLWAVNCLYFWPVLRKSSAHSHPQLRYYVVGSAIGFLIFTALLSSWALTFALGGDHLFGHVWNDLVMYNVADRYGLTGWI